MALLPSARFKRLVVAVSVATLTLLTTAPPISAQSAEPEPEPEPVIRSITFPVVGPVTYSDTWGACRGVRCSRSHKGVDLFGAKLQPLVAAADGVIVSIRRSGATSAGNKIVIEDAEGWRYHYFHLNNDSPGTDDGSNPQGWIIVGRLRLGDRVSAGDPIGYLGDSGNAERTPNHLHFEIHQPGVGAINPTPSVEAAEAEGRVVPTSALASTAEGRAQHADLVSAWYRALLKRPPTEIEAFAWTDRLALGLGDRADLIADLTMHPARRVPSGSVVRSFQVAFDRRPTITEFRTELGRYSSASGSETVVGGLLASSEFTDRYGSLDDAAFIEVVYRNARGRAPADTVRQYWAEQLASGRTRASMAAYFVDSYGLTNSMWHDLEVLQAFRAALDRFPSDEEFARWVGHLDRGGHIVDIVAAIRP